MDRDPKNGFSVRSPGFASELPYVVHTGLTKKTGDLTNLGHRPKLPIPETYSYFGHSAGRKNSKSENKQAPTLGNKWRRK